MIRVGNAPCSWGVLEFDPSTSLRAGPSTSLRPSSSSAPVAYTQVLDEIQQTGYVGTELGDWGFMPIDPARLAREVAQRDLQLIAAFVPIAFADPSQHADGIATAVRTAQLLRGAGAPDAFMVLSDDNASVPVRERNAGRIGPEHGLVDSQWDVFAAGVGRVARAVRDETGLGTVFHPHCGGYCETPSEIEELMRRTDSSLVGLALDTGHIVYGGGTPLDVLARYRSRVKHVHFKDCDTAVAASARAQGLGYLASVRARLFCELGAGAVDFAAVIAALRRMEYDGWIVVEQDVFAGDGTPAESARRSREYLRGLGI